MFCNGSRSESFVVRMSWIMNSRCCDLAKADSKKRMMEKQKIIEKSKEELIDER